MFTFLRERAPTEGTYAFDARTRSHGLDPEIHPNKKLSSICPPDEQTDQMDDVVSKYLAKKDMHDQQMLHRLFEYGAPTTISALSIGSYVRLSKPVCTSAENFDWTDAMDHYHQTIGLVVGVKKTMPDVFLVVVCKNSGGRPEAFIFDRSWLTPVSTDQVAEQIVRQLAAADRLYMRASIKLLMKDPRCATDHPEHRVGALVKRVCGERAPVGIVLGVNPADELVYVISVAPTCRFEQIEFDKIGEPNPADFNALTTDQRRELCAMHAYVAHKYALIKLQRTRMVTTSVVPLPMARIFAPPPTFEAPLPNAASI